MTFTATYSPDDNKLRLYASSRLDAETYARVKAAGFTWAPKQDLFVAPMWTPDRADLLIELAGELDDEDTSLTDRAEERAERFDGYQERRARDAEAARRAVDAIADGIPLGQPILVGHHSERHARRDAEKIQSGMRRAVRMWETSKYWKARAAGAIHHAKYKERPDVRARRIKTIEADRRKREKESTEARQWIKAWGQLNDPHKDGRPCDDALRLKRAAWIANYSHITLAATSERPYGDSLWSALDQGTITPRAAQLLALKVHGQTIKHARRWITHFDLRLDYERAMLAEAGGLITERTDYPIVPGGRVLIGSEWLTVIRVNRQDGRICSVTTNARYVRVRGIETVKNYEPPTTEAIAAVKAAKKLPPLLNTNSPSAIRMTAAEWKQKHADYKTTRTAEATAEHGAYRYRVSVRGGHLLPVFLTDAKVSPLPEPDDTPTPPTVPPPERSATQPRPEPPPPNQATATAAPFEAMRESLRAGVQVVAAPQLFPTPPDVARRVIELADIRPGDRVLEPSAGTGALLAAIEELAPDCGAVLAVELNAALADRLRAAHPLTVVYTADFLTWAPDAPVDRIAMNPPFNNGSDIEHIQHARRFLKPGGRLVAICANGPRQQAQLRPDAETWIELPAGTFTGTNARAAIAVFELVPAERPTAIDLLALCESGDDQPNHG